jgi:hypothetical protein
LYHHLRIATRASLILFTGVVAVGSLLLFSRVTSTSPPGGIRAGISPPSPSPLENAAVQGGSAATNASVAALSSAAAGKPFVAESVPAEPAAKAADSSVSAEAAAQAVQASVPAEAVPEKETPAPEHAARSAPSAAGVGKHKRVAKAKVPLPPLKKTAHRERPVRRPSNEALRAMPRFGEPRRDIRLDAYAAGQIPRRIPIRPTSIQDVYYYSIPR